MKKEPTMTQAAEKACPREPTAEMVEAGQRIRGLYRWRIEAIWQAMFDAAPPAPAVPVEVAEMIKRLRVDAEWHRGCSRGDMARNADQAADMLAALSQQPSPVAVGEGLYISPALAEVTGIVAAMHTKWMQREELMREQGGFSLMERMADLMDGIVDAVPELSRKLHKAIAAAPAPSEGEDDVARELLAAEVERQADDSALQSLAAHIRLKVPEGGVPLGCALAAIRAALARAGQGYGRGVRDAAAVAQSVANSEQAPRLAEVARAVKAGILALAAPLQTGEG